VANNKSALKRIQIAERNRLHNRAYKSAVKTLTKHFYTALNEYEANPSPEAMEQAHSSMAAAYSKIDRAVKRGVLHANNGARKKASLARALKQHEVRSAS